MIHQSSAKETLNELEDCYNCRQCTRSRNWRRRTGIRQGRRLAPVKRSWRLARVGGSWRLARVGRSWRPHSRPTQRRWAELREHPRKRERLRPQYGCRVSLDRPSNDNATVRGGEAFLLAFSLAAPCLPQG